MYAMASPYDPRAAQIEAVMYRLHVSVRELAAMVRKNHVSIGEWLKGEKNPRDKSVWPAMLDALAEHERRLRDEGSVRIRIAGRLTIPVLAHSEDVASLEPNRQTGVYGKTMVIADPENGREHWGRPVEDGSLGALANLGDVLVYDARPYEPTNVVDVWHDGRHFPRVVVGHGAAMRLRAVDPAYPDLDPSVCSIRGVAVKRVEERGEGVTVTTDFRYGMRHRF